MSETSFKHVVRMVGFDLPGDVKVPYAISRIRGVGLNLALALTKQLGIDPTLRLGEVEEEKLESLERVLRDKKHVALPIWFKNRRSDVLENEDMHLIGSDLLMGVRGDVELLKRIKCWRGVRHSLGLKVRGQRTRVTGRFGRSVGVSKGKLKQVGASSGQSSQQGA
ncbi:MAG: 30S ribosomal protein S13 [Thermoprotei archaeon]